MDHHRPMSGPPPAHRGSHPPGMQMALRPIPPPRPYPPVRMGGIRPPPVNHKQGPSPTKIVPTPQNLTTLNHTTTNTTPSTTTIAATAEPKLPTTSQAVPAVPAAASAVLSEKLRTAGVESVKPDPVPSTDAAKTIPESGEKIIIPAAATAMNKVNDKKQAEEKSEEKPQGTEEKVKAPPLVKPQETQEPVKTSVAPTVSPAKPPMQQMPTAKPAPQVPVTQPVVPSSQQGGSQPSPTNQPKPVVASPAKPANVTPSPVQAPETPQTQAKPAQPKPSQPKPQPKTQPPVEPTPKTVVSPSQPTVQSQPVVPSQPVAPAASPSQPVLQAAAPSQPVAQAAAPVQPVAQAAASSPPVTQATASSPPVTQAAASSPPVTQAAAPSQPVTSQTVVTSASSECSQASTKQSTPEDKLTNHAASSKGRPKAESPTPKKKRKRTQTPPPSTEIERPKRSRVQTQVYQSPIPENTYIPRALTVPKPPVEKCSVFFKGEHLAVRNAEGGFYVCQLQQNVQVGGKKIKIRWLSEVEKEEGLYSPDFYDATDFECILTNLTMDRLDKEKYKLPEKEKARVLNILERALKADETGERPAVVENHPDGIDVSMIKDESQLRKRRSENLKKEEGEEEEEEEEEEKAQRTSAPSTSSEKKRARTKTKRKGGKGKKSSKKKRGSKKKAGKKV